MAFVYQYNGKIILKAYQIGINKSQKDLEKLNNDFLLFDLNYFCQKLLNEKNIKIDLIELCLITTYNAYVENINKLIKTDIKKYNYYFEIKKPEIIIEKLKLMKIFQKKNLMKN